MGRSKETLIVSKSEPLYGAPAGTRPPAGGQVAGKTCCLLQRMTLCIRASREIGANRGIDQFANWSINTAPRCLTLIRVIREAAKRYRHLFWWRYLFGAPAGTRTPASLLLRNRLRRSFRFAQKTLRVLVSVGSGP